MPRALTMDLIRRLAFVRYLYGLGVDQSHKPEPFAAFAVLTFHDACEMFLQISAEHNGVASSKRRSPDFLEYWELFEQQAKLQVTSKGPMDRLNRARANLKHGGVLPAHHEIEGFRATVTSFLEDNALALLGVNLNDVSLTSMIRSDDVRGPLERAETALSAGNLQSALEEVACAFTASLRRFESRPRASTQPLDLYSLQTRHFSFFRPSFGDDLSREVYDIRRTLDRVVEAIRSSPTTWIWIAI